MLCLEHRECCIFNRKRLNIIYCECEQGCNKNYKDFRSIHPTPALKFNLFLKKGHQPSLVQILPFYFYRGIKVATTCPSNEYVNTWELPNTLCCLLFNFVHLCS